MAKREILAGATDQTIDLFIQDSSSTIGAGLSGLVYNSAGLACYYRKGATGSATALTLATQTVGGAHSDGGFVEIQATNMKGVYRLDLSDTIVASAGMVTIYLYGATNMAPVASEIEVVSVNKFDSVRMGLTALPNAAAEAAGGLYTRGTGAGQINQDGNGRIDSNATHAAGTAWGSGAITAASIAADAITAAKIATGAIDADAIADNAIDAGALAADCITAAKIANGAIDAATFAADTGLILRANTCQAGSTGTTIVLDAGASATNSTYVGCNVAITGGTGVGQVRTITAYAGGTVTATVPTWQTTPDGTSTFAILPGYAVIAVLGSVTGNVAGSVGSVTGAVGSVTGAVGSVTGNVGGNVTGSVGSVATGGIAAASFAAGAIDAAAIATGAIDADALAADAGTEIGTAVWATASRTLTANTNFNDPTAAAVASAVVGETITELAAIPAASPTLKQALALLYMALRNKVTVTSSAKTVYNDAGTALGAKALSDDGTTYTEAEIA